MARLATMGFEWGDDAADLTVSAATANGASVSAARTGTYGLRVSNSNRGWFIPGTPALARTYFLRSYFRTDASPAVQAHIMWAITAGDSDVVFVELNTDLTVTLESPNGTQIGSASSALSVNTWYRIELSFQLNSGAADDQVALRIDGVDIASTTTATAATTAPNRFLFGDSAVHNANFDYDDAALNDDQGANQNSWPGEGQIVLCVPVSDNQDGSWTAGGGGTSLFDALDNKPPVGATAPGTNTTQIRTNDASGNNATDECRLNLTTYTSAGIGASDTITVIQPVASHGEEVSTNTKTGSMGLQSNPSDTYATFNYGDDAGACGTYDTNWKVCNGTPTYAPSPTLGSSPVVAARKTDAGTRFATICALGLYIDYVPSAAAPSHLLPNRNLAVIRR